MGEPLDDTVAFGPFQLAATRRLLTRMGEPVPLGDRALEMLAVLVEHAPNLVSKKMLFERVWPGLFVEESNLRFQMRALRRALGEDDRYIATVTGRGYCFVAPVVRPDRIATRAASADTNLRRPLTDIVGRERELAELRKNLECNRLITVIGPGGVGKTRLAIELGWRMLADFPAGVWLIDLAPLTDPEMVVNATATALGVSLTNLDKAVEAIVGAIGPRPRLLVFDNCEHLVAGAARLVKALLERAPNLSVLATSQESLAIQAESVHRLSPLALPPRGATQIAGFAAVDLFVARARTAYGLFALDSVNTPSVAEICRGLDGVPLALEMAAARLHLLGVNGLRAGLDERLKMLTEASRGDAARHDSLRAVVEWSHGLLEPRDQTVFRRLAIFTGSFSLEAAIAVAGADEGDRWEIVDALGRLVDKSLITIEDREPVRYRLLETLRLFATEGLYASGDGGAAARRHALHYKDVLESAYIAWETTPDADWIARYRPEIDNLRAALDWALAEPARQDIAMALAGPGLLLFHVLFLIAEGRRYFERLASLIDQETPPAVAASVLRHAMNFWNYMPEPRVLAYVERTADLYRQLDDRPGLGFTLSALGFLHGGQGRHDTAKAILSEASELIGRGELKKTRIELYRHLGLTAIYMNEIPEARAYLTRALDMARALGSMRESGCLNNLAVLEYVVGDIDRSVDLAREAVVLGRGRPGLSLATALSTLASYLLTQGNSAEARDAAEEAFVQLVLGDFVTPRFLQIWAVLSGMEGRLTEAAQLIGYVDAERARRGEPQVRSERPTYADLSRRLEAGLAPADLRALKSEGARWDLAEATEFVSNRLLSPPPSGAA